MAEAAKKLKVNQISEIIKSSYGYHILQVTEKFPESTLPLSEVKSDILNILLKKEVEKKKESLLSKMRESAKIKLFL